MKRPAHAVKVELKIPFHDCDPLSVAWHGRYFEYLELSRTALLQSCRLDVPDMHELGVRMFVSDARCRYNSPLHYGDEVAVCCWFRPATHLLRISYDVYNVTKARRAARAYTHFALTDEAGKWLSEIPTCIAERLPE